MVSADYEAQWKKHKRIRNQFWFVFAAYVPLGFVVMELATWLHFNALVFAYAFTWMALFVIAGGTRQYL